MVDTHISTRATQLSSLNTPSTPGNVSYQSIADDFNAKQKPRNRFRFNLEYINRFEHRMKIFSAPGLAYIYNTMYTYYIMNGIDDELCRDEQANVSCVMCIISQNRLH